MKLDEINMKILKNLLLDARQSARKLSITLGLSTVTVISRIKKLEKENIIKRYSAILDHEKLGYSLPAVIEVITKKGKVVEVEKELANMDNICAVYDVTGNTDTIIVAKFKGREDLSSFVKELSSLHYVKNTITHVVLNSVKEDFRLI